MAPPGGRSARRELGDSPRGRWRRFFDRFTGFMVIVLIVAAVISGAPGEVIDTVASIAIVVLNAVTIQRAGARDLHRAPGRMRVA